MKYSLRQKPEPKKKGIGYKVFVLKDGIADAPKSVKQGEEEVVISAHQIESSKVVKELTESKLLWNRFRGDSNSLGENQGSALTPSANNPSGKDSVLNPHSNGLLTAYEKKNPWQMTRVWTLPLLR